MILPGTDLNLVLQSGSREDTLNQSSKTWQIDFDKNKINGHIDELDSVKQSVFLALQTERYKYLIYSHNYGSELNSLIGKDYDYAVSEVKRTIYETLLTDERIIDVNDFEFATNGNALSVSFSVITVFGNLYQEVQVSV